MERGKGGCEQKRTISGCACACVCVCVFPRIWLHLLHPQTQWLQGKDNEDGLSQFPIKSWLSCASIFTVHHLSSFRSYALSSNKLIKIN